MKIRVYYEDTDCGNVVYYANYLRYMERSRTEYLRERGVNLADYHKQGYVFAVTDVTAKYRRPARYNDLIEVETKITEVTTIAIIFETSMYGEHQELLFTGTAKIVCIDAKTGRAAMGPKEMFEPLQKEIA
jgi:tol-pal system-associated acyl-CoA thioesterase